MTFHTPDMFKNGAGIDTSTEHVDPIDTRLGHPEEKTMTALDLAAGLFKFEQIIDYDWAFNPNEVGMKLPNGRLIFLVSTGTRYVFVLSDEEGNPGTKYEGFIEDMADKVEEVIRKHGQ